jgi:hypothetical protein
VKESLYIIGLDALGATVMEKEPDEKPVPVYVVATKQLPMPKWQVATIVIGTCASCMTLYNVVRSV